MKNPLVWALCWGFLASCFIESGSWGFVGTCVVMMALSYGIHVFKEIYY